jgi:hypothetical protein
MPPLGPAGPRRTNAAAYKRRARNIARIPKAPAPRSAGPPNFPRAVPKRPGQIVTAVPKAHIRPTAPAQRGPTPAQLRQSRIAEKQYKSQAGAVRRVAKTQKATGPGVSARPARGTVLRQADVDRASRESQSLKQEAALRSLGEAVSKIAQGKDIETAAHRKVKIGGLDVEAGRLSADPRMQKAIGLKAPGKLEAAISSPKYAIKYGLKPAVSDVKDIVIGMPTSLVKLGVDQGKAVKESIKQGSVKPLVKAEKETAKALAQPYIETAKNPAKAFAEHPISTTLMFAPTAKVPKLALGRGARLAGKQTLERPPAKLEGTTLKQQRVGSRDVEKRARQAREDKKNPNPQISTTAGLTKTAELDRRVDEAFDAGQQHKQRAHASALKRAKRDTKDLPRKERKAEIQARVEGAAAGAHQEVDRRFAREFGSHWDVHPQHKGVIRPAQAPELGGKLHTSREDAERVVEALKRDKKVNWDPHVMKVEHVEGGDAWAVVPKVAAERFRRQKVVGTSPAIGAVNRRVAVKQFKKTVLPFSAPWLLGQASEAGIRNLAAGAGPASYIRARRVLKRMPEHERRELLGRSVQPAQFGATGSSGEFASGGGRTLAEEYARSPEAKPYVDLLTKVGKAPPLRQLRAAHRAYSHGLFNEVNGRIEQLSKTALLGKQIKRSPLMERRLLGLSDKAMQEAADGLHSTAAQVELGRQLDNAYGKYSKFSPSARETITHQTPFIPWFLNMARFNLSVMPRNHPVKTSLLAAYTNATEEWRKQQQLSYHAGKDQRVPDWLMGSYPAFGGKVRVGRFGPFVPGEYGSAVGGQFTPMAQGALMNLAGVDWTGKELKGASQEKLAGLAGLTIAEGLIPGLSQAERLTGFGDKLKGKKQPGGTATPTVGHGKRVDKAIVDMLNPLKPVKGPGGAGGKGKGPKLPDIKVKDIKLPDIKLKDFR